MFKAVARGLVLALTLGGLAGGVASSQARRGAHPPPQPRAGASPAPTGRPPSSASDQDAELEFVDSEQGFWTSRAVNAPVYQDGGSVNSVMFEQRTVRDLRRRETLPPTRLEEVRVTGRPAPATTLRIQGRTVALPAATTPER